MDPTLMYSEQELTVEIVSDGTTTSVKLVDDEGEVIGMGTAKRKKGDTRNQALGVALAMQNAMISTATALGNVVDKHFTGRSKL